MPSGNKSLIYNTRERLISTDPNRAQAFIGRDVAELLRMYDAQYEMDSLAAGSESLGTITQSPLRGLIFEGLRVRPEVGTVNCFVEQGVAAVVDPDSTPSPDDSVYKWIVDPGVQTGGQLVYTPNASGSIRVDVIECQRTDVVLETDNRDIFNSSTGLFSPVAVNKVRAGRFTYRIRLGTPGSGYPGTATGWLPLAVAASPNAATTWDHVSLWDVRPLAVDFQQGAFNVSRTVNGYRKALVGYDLAQWSGSNTVRLQGLVEGTVGARVAGGTLRSGVLASPPAAAALHDYVDVTDTANQEAGTAFSSASPWFLWLLFPFNLPRWARYSEVGSGSRVPNGPRGIPVVSVKGPGSMKGGPSASISLPTALGLGSGTNVGLLAAAGLCDGAFPVPSLIDGTVTRMALDAVSAAYSPTSTTSDTAVFAFADNVHWPANARAVHLRFEGTVGNGGKGIGRTVQMAPDLDGTNSFDAVKIVNSIIPPAPSGSYFQAFEQRLPLFPTWPGNLGVAAGRCITWTHNANANGTTLTAPKMRVMGWELGP